jgi:aminoglycoside phosphotransferase (APT) family kinase protein
MPQPQDDKIAWKVISPPPWLSLDDADALLTAWRGSQTVVEVRSLQGGIMNWNYGIRLSGSAERFVLRFYDRMPASCAKEVRLLALVADALPVPRVMMAMPAGAAGYPPFCVLEFIDGISLRELRRRGDTQGVAEACHDAGRLLPRLMRHRFDRAGLLSSDLDIHDGPFAGAAIRDVVEHLAAAPSFRRRIDSTLRQRLLAFTDESASIATDAGATASLTHGDFNSPNILVHQTNGRWSVAAILDWEFAFAGSTWCDVGNMLRYERPGQPRYEPSFSRGLVDGGLVLSDDWFRRARLADLPALCELLARDDVPEAIVVELGDLMRETVDR